MKSGISCTSRDSSVEVVSGSALVTKLETRRRPYFYQRFRYSRGFVKQDARFHFAMSYTDKTREVKLQEGAGVPCCAYCYITITTLASTGEKLRSCGKCSTRKYCSRECQVLDWKSGHKHFCGITGEANVDWEIRHCTEKGFGIFALRDLEKDDKVMAERPALGPDRHLNHALAILHGNSIGDTKEENIHQSVYHRGITNLYSSGPDNIDEKFKLNAFDHEDQEKAVYIQLSRVNHACYGNSTHRYSKNRKVRLLVASRAIQAGEEITFSYRMQVPLHETRQNVQDHYGFSCQCLACSNPVLGAELEHLFSLEKAGSALVCERSPRAAIRTLKMCLKLYDKYGMSTWYYHWIYWYMFHAERMMMTANGGKSSKQTSKVYIRKAYEAAVVYTSDKEDERVVELKEYMTRTF